MVSLPILKIKTINKVIIVSVVFTIVKIEYLLANGPLYQR